MNLSTLQRVFKSGDTVSLETLKEQGVLKKSVKDAKILAVGEIKKKLTVKDLPVSASAQAKIEAAGGTVSGGAPAAAEAAAPDAAAVEPAAADQPAVEKTEATSDADDKE